MNVNFLYKTPETISKVHWQFAGEKAARNLPSELEQYQRIPLTLSARDPMNLSDAPHTGDTTNLVCLVSKCFGLQKWINSLGTGGYQG